MRCVRSEQGNTAGQNDKVWESIRAETGYSSYNEYLYESAQRHLFSLEQELGTSKEEESRSFMCSVVSLSRNENSTITISSQDYHSEANRGETATEVLKDLRQPPPTAYLRVVLWWGGWDDEKQDQPKDLFNVCSLGLKIHPRFFEAFIDRADKYSLNGLLRPRLVQPSLPDDPYRPKYTVIGNHISTIARDYIIGRADTPPVLLIVGWNDGRGDYAWHHEDYDNFDPSMLHSNWCEPGGESHFQAPIVGKYLNNEAPILRRSRNLRSRTYVELLDHLLKENASAVAGKEHLLILSTLPLMHLDTLHMHAKMRSLRCAFICNVEDAEYADDVKHQRTMLRRHIEDSEMSSKKFERYVHSQEGGDLLRRQDFMRIEELWRDALSQARLLETEVRDNMQLEASQLSLQESRKSIELSNHQIEENRRGSYS